MKRVYHLDVERAEIEGARITVLPGDPARVERIAQALDEGARELAWNREYRACLGTLGDRPVLVMSTGKGGPSASIAVDEFAQLGVETFLHVGTTGSIGPDVASGDVVFMTGAVRPDGPSTHYAPIEYPAVAHHEVVRALADAARAEGVRYHIGVTAPSDTFYPG